LLKQVLKLGCPNSVVMPQQHFLTISLPLKKKNIASHRLPTSHEQKDYHKIIDVEVFWNMRAYAPSIFEMHLTHIFDIKKN
jgi:hypothetical protein